MGNNKCSECKHWRIGFNNIDEPGECRRYPPTKFDGDTAFPNTYHTDECGEWEKKPNTSGTLAMRGASGKIIHS